MRAINIVIMIAILNFVKKYPGTAALSSGVNLLAPCPTLTLYGCNIRSHFARNNESLCQPNNCISVFCCSPHFEFGSSNQCKECTITQVPLLAAAPPLSCPGCRSAAPRRRDSRFSVQPALHPHYSCLVVRSCRWAAQVTAPHRCPPHHPRTVAAGA